jgi:hypothetical protein
MQKVTLRLRWEARMNERVRWDSKRPTAWQRSKVQLMLCLKDQQR